MKFNSPEPLSEKISRQLQATDIESEQIFRFYWFFFPSYIFLCLSTLRYFAVLRGTHSKSHIKSNIINTLQILCYVMALTYCSQLAADFLVVSTIHATTSHKLLRLLYMCPVSGWLISYHMTTAEVNRDITPRRYNQFTFSCLSFIAASARLFFHLKTDTHVATPLNDVIQVVFSAMTGFFFIKSEKVHKFRSSMSRSFLEGYPLRPIVSDPERLTRGGSQRVALPAITVSIDKTVERKQKARTIVENYFWINVHINNKAPYQVAQPLSQFVELERDMKTIYTLSRFPLISTFLPLLDHKFIEKALYQDGKRDLEVIEKLETYVSEIVERPEFMQEIVLDFLEIPEPYRGYFLQFIDDMEGRSSYQQSLGRSNTGLSGAENRTQVIDQKAVEDLDIFKLQLLHLDVKKLKYYQSEIEGEIIYTFEIHQVEKGMDKLTWTIAKSYNDFNLNHRKLEAQLNLGLPDLQSFVPEMFEAENELDPVQLERTLGGLEKYLKTLLSAKRLYCATLFEFIGVDPVTWQKGYSCSENDFLMNDDA